MRDTKRTLSWLHLSDLHRCPARDGDGATITLRRLLDDLKTLLADEPPVDFLFFTGDAAFGQISGNPLDDQFQEAWEWLEKAREICDLETDRVFLVPGNHDIDRGEVTEKAQEWLRARAQEYASDRIHRLLQEGGKEWRDYSNRLEQYRTWIEACYPHLLQDDERLYWAHRIEIDGLRVGIGGFDSAWSCGENDEKGRLWLGADAQLGWIVSRLEDVDLRIALIHHPPSWLVEAEDPGTLRSRLQSEFHVLLHGHEHDAWVETPQRDHLKIAAGAVHDRGGHAPFGYSLARFDLEAGTGKIWQRKWDERTGRWIGDKVGGRTDERGVWPLGRLPWAADADSTASADSASVEPDPAEEAAVPTAAERRGIFGREKDLAKLRRFVEKHRLVWIHGLSGVGKSTLIDQAILEMERTRLKIRLQPGMSFDEIYKLFAQELGSPEVNPRPIGLAGRVSFDPLKRWGQSLTRKTVLHVEGADAWLDSDSKDEGLSVIPSFLDALVEHLPKTVALVIESTITPKDIVPQSAKCLHLRGLDADCLVAFFRRPLPEQKPEVGWALEKEEQEAIAARVAGDRQKLRDLHPLALVLLAQVADELDLRPPEVFEHHAEAFDERVADGLFRLLVERVLGDEERRLLRLLALYRDGVLVPKEHADSLKERVDVRAFGSLVRRSVLERRTEGFHLHSLLRRIAHGRLDLESDEILDDHAVIARAWLDGVRRGRSLDLADVEANNEAFHHLEAAQLYAELSELQSDHLRRDIIPKLDRIGRELKRAGDNRNLRKVLELWAQIDGQNPKPFRFLGEVLVATEGPESDATLRAFRRAIDLGPDYPHHWSGYGRSLIARGEGPTFVEGIESLDLRRRQELLQNRFVAGIYASALEEAGREKDAEEERARAIREGTQHPAIYVDQAQYLLKNDRPEDALQVLRLARENDAEDPFTLSVRGKVLERLGKGSGAEEERARAIRERTRHPAIYVDQAQYLLKNDRPEHALEILELARENGAEDPFTLSVRGKVLERLGKGSDAEKERARAIRERTRDPAIYVDQAQYFLKSDRPEDALEVLRLARENGAANEYTETIETKVEAALYSKGH